MNITFVGIHKSFGDIHANNNINITIPSGTIHGILGENGAGKSTLMKVLSGYQMADSGDILFDNHKVAIKSPKDAQKFGIGMLHQDPLDFPPMTVLENFITGSKDQRTIRKIFLDFNEAKQEFLSIQNELGFNLKPEVHVDSLSVGERQQLEIIRLLWSGIQVLILDEPTTGISSNQKDILFMTLRYLAREGKTILFVSHKLEDIEELCDQISILRQGCVVGESSPPYEMEYIISAMFGKSIKQIKHKNHTTDEPSLVLDEISIEANRLEMTKISKTFYKGEVIGLAGMEGSGQLEFMRVCAGLIPPTAGKILINSVNMMGRGYLDFLSRGVSYIPAARLEEGLIPGMTISEHFLLVLRNKKFILDRQYADEIAQNSIDDFSIKGNPSTVVNGLSGGNQQRTQLALIKADSRIILMEHPTRGLDVESSIYVWKKLDDRCKDGATIIFISSDLEEIIKYSDRVIVFFAGKVSESFASKSITSDELGLMIGGKGW